MEALMDRFFLGNKVWDWLIALGMMILGIALVKIARHLLMGKIKKWAEKTKTSFDDFVVTIVEKSVLPFLAILCIYWSLQWLDNPPKPHWEEVAMLLVTTYFILLTLTAAVQYFAMSFLKTQEDGATKQKQARGLLIILKFVIWAMGIMFLLDNLGYNISTIIAGLGIGGIAIALAAQTILGDLFSYFVILFDRPFEIDDFIVVDDLAGVVEYIGVKTTRIRTLSGEQLICSNKNLTDSRIHNFKRMERRRVVLSIGVTYQTPADVLASIPPMVKKIISLQSNVFYDRGHFSGFG
ncbi:MAG: mechanosensitive ion channel, partial [Bacteroidota bacterium]|nr:mechanosensitive ion channel [Bacteroidota bacterium]